ncbi:MAG: class II aldolase/adducin family protein [Nocardioidaceae bacterium]
MTDTTTDLGRLRHDIATACRVLAARELAPGFLGHISLRVDAERLLVRCRGPHERGLAYTTADDIRLVDLDGAPGASGELDGGYAPPNELPLHTEVLRTRPEVDAVVHAHPARVVAADLAGISIRPIVGAYDIPGAKLAAGGVPVYRRAVLIRDRALAKEMVEAAAGRPVVLLRGHGLTSAGSSVPEAMIQAISVDSIAGMSLRVVQAGGTLRDISDEDLAQLPDLGPAFNEGVAWRHEVARLEEGQPSRTTPDDIAGL